MDKFTFNIKTIIPEETLAEVNWLRELIMKDLDIMISIQDAYLLWNCVYYDLWSHMVAVPTELTTPEFIREKMNEFGIIIKGV